MLLSVGAQQQQQQQQKFGFLFEKKKMQMDCIALVAHVFNLVVIFTAMLLFAVSFTTLHVH